MSRELWVVEEQVGEDWVPTRKANWIRGWADLKAEQFRAKSENEFRVVRYTPEVTDGNPR